MPKVEIELNSAGIRELLRSNEIGDYCEKIARDAAAKAGDGYSYDKKRMPTRIIASVFAADDKAYYDNLDNNTLLKAIGANR